MDDTEPNQKPPEQRPVLHLQVISALWNNKAFSPRERGQRGWCTFLRLAEQICRHFLQLRKRQVQRLMRTYKQMWMRISHNGCCSLTTSSTINIIAPTFSLWLRARSAPLLTASCVSVRFEKALTSGWLRLKRLKGKTDSFTLLHNLPLPGEPQQRTHVHRRHFAAISWKCLYLTMRLMSCLH